MLNMLPKTNEMNKVKETSEMNKLKLLNSILIKELKEFKYENSKLKQENETLKIENEELKDKNEKLMAGNITVKTVDHDEIQNQFDSQTEKLYKCEICGKENVSNEDLKSHVISFHIKKENYETDVEALNGKNEKLIAGGGNTKSKSGNNISVKKYFRCDQCEKEFGQMVALANHKMFVHEEDQGNSLVVKIKIHKNKVDEGIIKVFRCDQCKITFEALINLKKHNAHVHEERKNVPCPMCPKLLKTKESLKNHIAVVHEENLKSTCHLCGKGLTNPNYLKIHIMTVHEGQKKFVCPTCGQHFAQSPTLKKHILLIHEKRKDLKCETCSRAFALKGDLKKHIMAIHHGIKYAGVAKLRKEENYKLQINKLQTKLQNFKQIKDLLNDGDLDQFGQKGNPKLNIRL